MGNVPDLADVLDRLHVVALPMRVRFRGITVREVALIDGPRAGPSSAPSRNTLRRKPRPGSWQRSRPPGVTGRCCGVSSIPISTATVPAIDAAAGARGARPVPRCAHREGESWA